MSVRRPQDRYRLFTYGLFGVLVMAMCGVSAMLLVQAGRPAPSAVVAKVENTLDYEDTVLSGRTGVSSANALGNGCLKSDDGNVPAVCGERVTGVAQ